MSGFMFYRAGQRYVVRWDVDLLTLHQHIPQQKQQQQIAQSITHTLTQWLTRWQIAN